MWTIVGAIATVVGVVIALCHYIHDIRKDKKQKNNLYRIIISAVLLTGLHFVPVKGALRFLLYLIPYFIIGYDVLRKAFKGIKNRQPMDESLLMCVATIGAMALAIGIAIQNFPEGAIISMPLFAEGKSKPKSFWLGVFSGAVEPVFGGLTVLIASLVVPAMPYFLSFAAGAMLYVVVEELIPEMSSGEHSNIGVIFFAVGFSLMMALDVALG